MQVTDLFPEPHLLNFYLKQDPVIRPFFPLNYQNPADWNSILSERISFPADIRETVHQVLEKQNRGISPQIDRNLEVFKQENSVVIVTGQQAGFFGGPLFTLFKTLSAVKWCEELKEKFPGVNFIPVFWVETEDHDFQEIAWFRQPEKPATSFNQSTDDRYLQIQYRKVSQEFESYLEEIKQELPKTEFFEPIWQDILTSLSDGSFSGSFVSLMQKWLSGFGILFLTPADPEIKKIGYRVLKTEIESGILCNEVKKQSGLLIQAGFTPQVTPRTLNCFYIRNGRRYGLEFTENGRILLAGLNETFLPEDFLKETDSRPESLSPNVVSRPLFQDTVLPTAGVILGPGELSYWAQLSGAYTALGTPMPLAIPRTFGLVCEPQVERLLGKFKLDAGQILLMPHLIESKITDETGFQAEKEFRQFWRNLEPYFISVQNMTGGIDPTLIDSWTQLTGRTSQSFSQFFDRLEKTSRKKKETEISQLKRIRENLLPDGQWQERSVSFLYFLVKYGPDFITAVYNQMTCDPYFHIFTPSPKTKQENM